MKISFQKDIDITSLYQLITSHVIHGFFYTSMSRNTFNFISNDDKSLNLVDMRDKGMGYMWHSYNNLINIIIDESLKDNELIYLNDDDIFLMVRNKKINWIKNKILK